MTKEELVTFVQSIMAQFGTYEVEGDKMTFTVLAAKSPNAEGQSGSQICRMDNGDLVCKNADGTEDRLHRVTPHLGSDTVR
jgi:hypothetical protein